VATQQDFGRELTIARQRAGLTVREVARSAGLPPSTAGDYFSGRHLPPPGQPGLREILRACGETDPARLQEWATALARVRRAPGPRASGSRAPYRGLESFQQADAAWFFGRTDVTERLVALTEEAADGAAQAGSTGVPLAVVGPSGSGKSSLLRAGLIPRLLGGPAPAGGRALALFTPGGSPLAELAAQLRLLAAGGPGHMAAGRAASEIQPGQAAAEIEAALSADPAGAAHSVLAGVPGGLVIVVDQFEEAFTDCQDEEQRQAFIGAVCALSGPAVVVLALRADFYDRALRYAELATALQERQVVLGPMSPEQVRSAIVEPARLMRLDVEDGLVEALLRDLAPMTAHSSPPGAAHDAGALPLLSHALLATWEHSHGGKLLVADYQASGGIRDAIARTAEKVYAGLASDQQEIARRIFLRLVHVADDAPDTRSTVALSDLPGLQDGSPASDLLGRFVAERLITMDAETAQISHDALLTAWPRLRAWIDTDHENLMIRRRIRESAQAWEEAGRDGAALLRGSRLAIARSWAANQDNRASLGQLAHEFVNTSVTEQDTRQRAARSRSRRLHRLAAALAALALVTVTLAGYAFQQRQAANSARDGAMTALDNAESRAVAIEADQVRAQDVALAGQLGLAAYRIAGTPDARSSLLDSSGTPAASRLADSAGQVQSVSLSPGRRVLAVAAADGTLRLWEVAQAGRPAPLGAPLLPKGSESLYAAAFSPDGQILAAAGAGRTVSLWNVSNPGDPVKLGIPLAGPGNTVYSLAFSPDGRILAAGSADDTVRLWDIAGTGHPGLLATLTGAAGYIESVAFSPDGRTLAAGSADATVRLWNLADPARPRPLGRPLRGPAAPVTSVAFSPHGQLLAAGSQDHKVWLWKTARPGRPVRAEPPLAGATNGVNAVAFSPDGRLLAAGSSDSSVRVWNLASRQLTAVLPHPQPVTSLAWSGRGHLVSGDADGFARVWTLPSPVLQAGAPVNTVAFSPGGGTLAVGSTDLQLWNPRTREQLAAGPGRAQTGTVSAVAFSPSGKLLAAGYGNGMIQLWRRPAAGTLAPLGRPVRASGTGPVESVAFSRAGTVLATGGDDGTVRLWSVRDPGRPRPLAQVRDAGQVQVFGVAFSPDSRTLAAASSDGDTRLWEVADPARPAPAGKPLTGTSSYAISAAFSPDGQTLAVGSADKTVRLWSVSDPARPRLLGRPLTGPANNVHSVAFSPDGKMLAAGVADGTAWLWDVHDPARPGLLATLTGPALQVYSVAFGQGSRTLAAGSADGTVRLWETRPAAAANAVCATSGPRLGNCGLSKKSTFGPFVAPRVSSSSRLRPGANAGLSQVDSSDRSCGSVPKHVLHNRPRDHRRQPDFLAVQARQKREFHIYPRQLLRSAVLRHRDL
jgi:WD40 repeat protein/transcriptional regulator with XRE-family HTH domain